MTERRAVVTVVTRNYLHLARALAASLRETNPGLPLFVCLADRPPGAWDPTAEPFDVLWAEEIFTGPWPQFAFQYDGLELSCALKPYAIEELLDRGFDSVAYFDADMQLYGPLDGLWRELQAHAMVFTPHLRAPLAAGNELETLYAGALNLGFMALRDEATARAFLAWWKEKLRRGCVIDNGAHIFLDQSWASFAPALFADVGVDRHPGHNAAHYNLDERTVTRDGDGGRLAAGGEPLVFFHFNGFDPRRPELLTTRRGGVKAAHWGEAVAQLCRDYAARVIACGMAACEVWGYAYATLSDGTVIEPGWREAVRIEHPGLSGIADPFDVASTPGLCERLREAAATLEGTRLDWLHRERHRRLRELERRLDAWERSRSYRVLQRLRGWYAWLRRTRWNRDA